MECLKSSETRMTICSLIYLLHLNHFQAGAEEHLSQVEEEEHLFQVEEEGHLLPVEEHLSHLQEEEGHLLLVEEQLFQVQVDLHDEQG